MLPFMTDMLAVVSEILDRGVSINLYMFHGGTSFGFMNGAMDFGAYKSQVTSYGRVGLTLDPRAQRSKHKEVFYMFEGYLFQQ